MSCIWWLYLICLFCLSFARQNSLFSSNECTVHDSMYFCKEIQKQNTNVYINIWVNNAFAKKKKVK